MLEYLNHTIYPPLQQPEFKKKGKKKEQVTYLSSITYNYSTLFLTTTGKVLNAGEALLLPSLVVNIALVRNSFYAIDVDGKLYDVLYTAKEESVPEPVKSIAYYGLRYILLTATGRVYVSVYGGEWKLLTLSQPIENVVGNWKSIYLGSKDNKWYSLLQGGLILPQEDHVLALDSSVTRVEVDEKGIVKMEVEGKGLLIVL